MNLSGPLKAFLLAAGGIAAAAIVAYFSGALDRFIQAPPVAVTEQPAPAAPEAQPTAPGDTVAAPDGPRPGPEPEVIPPSFDLVRVEPDGSIVIAGKAAPNSTVEALAGSKVIGQSKAGPEGDFAIVVEEPLAPGAYQIVLRATDEAGIVATSPETAVVSIPEKPDGQILALVEQPGQPSKLITVPEPAPVPEIAEPEPDATAETPVEPADSGTPAAEAEAPSEPSAPDTAAAPEEPAPEEPAPEIAIAPATPAPATPESAPRPQVEAPKLADEPHVEVRAVEIEGNMVFVAGTATPDGLVRVYANEFMLGETRASEGGQFLVEALRELPVGDYIVRADLIGPDGIQVIRRAQVPFRRPAGEAIAAVAPEPKPEPQPAAPEPAAPESTEAQPAPEPEQAAPAETPGEPKPAETAEVPAAPEPAAPEAPAPVAQAEPETPAPAAEAAPETPAPVAEAAPAAPQPAEPEIVVPDPGLALGSEPPVVTAAPLEPTDASVIIRRGDTLWQISRRVYGRGVRYSTIYLANQDQIADPNRIWPGQVFAVPDKTDQGEAADLDAISDRIAPSSKTN